MSTTKPTLTDTDVFDRMQDDPRWLGWGYLGERSDWLRLGPEERDVTSTAEQRRPVVLAADAAILTLAVAQSWSYNQLFDWANSGAGRRYADRVFVL